MYKFNKTDLANLISKIPNLAILGFDKKFNIIFWNEASEKLFGYTKAEALGKKIEDLILADCNKNKVLHSLNDWFFTKKPMDASELILKNKEESDINVYSSHMMIDEDTNEPKIFCMDMDISSQKKEEEKLNTFFELAINLQIVATTSGEILQINNAAKTMLGYEKEELINTSFMELVHPDDITNTINEMTKLSKGEIIYYFENRYRHKDGSYVNLAWSAVTNTSNNLIYASAQNITSVKLIEEEKRNQEKMLIQHSKTAAVGEMIGNISHQWRQPLSVISTASTGLKLSIELGLEPDSKILISTLDSINSHTQGLSETIEDFRSFFKDDLVVIKNHNLKDTLLKIRNLTLDSFNIDFIEYFEESEDIYLDYNENIFIQAFLNIFNNSKDALLSRKGNRYFFMSIKKVKKNVIIKIHDNAGGIKKDIISRVFEPYFTTKHESVGTGIGLYMTHQIITKQLHGNISVDNISFEQAGTHYIGAEFIITIPM